MSESPSGGQDADLHQRRRDLFHGLAVINSLNFSLVALVAALATVAIFLGWKARQDSQRLWEASLTQARASRFGGEIGWRSNALATISRAAEIRPSLGLRNEAIAALTTPDIEVIGRWHSSVRGYYTTSPDLQRIFCCSDGQTIRMMDSTTGKELRQFKFPGPITLTVDPSGQFLAARNQSGALSVWLIETGEEQMSLKPPANQRTYDTFAFTTDEIAYGLPGGKIELRRLRGSGAEQVRTIETGLEFELLAADDSGTKLLGSQRTKVQVWDAKTGKLDRQLTCPTNIASIAIAPGGKAVAVGAADYHVYLWRDFDPEPIKLSGHQGLVFQVAFGRNGERLTSCAYGGTTRMWETTSGELLLATESLFIDRFATRGDLVMCSRAEGGVGLARLADYGVARSVRLASKSSAELYPLSFISERRAVVPRNDSFQVVDVDSGEVFAEEPGNRNRGSAYVPQRSELFTTGLDGLHRWKVQQPEKSQLLLGSTEEIVLPSGRPNEGVHASLDGTELLARIGLESAVLVDIASGKQIAVFPCANIGGYALSPDKSFVATGTFHGAGTKVWRRDGTLIKDLHDRDAAPAFSPDGRWLATSSSDQCTIYDTKTFEPRWKIAMQSASALPGILDFSPDSSLLAFSERRQSIRLVNPETGENVAQFEPAKNYQLTGIVFSPSGKKLFATTTAGMLLDWDLAALETRLNTLNLGWSHIKAPPHERAWGGSLLNIVALIACLTLLTAVAFAAVTWSRHRKFMAAYRQIESIMEQRTHELAQAQSELFRSQKMRALGTLAAGIAHDFNNLLSIIRLSNQLTIENAADNAEAVENARMIERAVNQGKAVVRAMLGYSRTSGDKEEYPAAEVVRETVAMLRPQFLGNVDVRLDVVNDVGLAIGVRNRFEQALLNLIVNAAEAMNGSGVLKVTLRTTDHLPRELALRPTEATRYIELIVGDSGPGMTPEVMSRIFEPFFTTKNVGKQRGTGLGLSMVYGICKEEGIGILVKSAAGSGAEFYLFIPAASAKTAVPSESRSDTVAA